jgi:signal transduction histidine kinase
MSRRGNIGRPLVIIITVALASMTAVSSFLVFTAQQTTEARIELVSSQTLRKNLAEESMQVVGSITSDLQNIEKTLGASAGALAGSGPSSGSSRQTIELTKSALQYADDVLWLDAQGKLLYATKSGSQNLVGSDLSDKSFYEIPLATRQPSVIPAVDGINGTSSFAVAVPIPATGTGGTIGGVLAAVVPTDYVYTSLLKAEGDKELVVVANDGTILVHPTRQLEGKSITGPEVRATLADDSRDLTISNLRLMAQGRSGITDYHEKNGNASLMAFEPVMINGAHTWSVGILQPTSTIREPFLSIFAESQNFTFIATGLIAAISGIFIAFILVLNRWLFSTVGRQDAKIRSSLAELQSAYERLKEQDIIKDEFINIAAHELRTPVLPMMLSAENLADKMPEDENIRIILRNANRITKLTNDILDVSRIESNTLRLQKQQTNIKKLIEEVIQDAQFKVSPQQQVEILFDSRVPPSMEELTIDRSRINQVLVNIVDNAINFTENGTIRVVLEPDRDSAGHVRVSVIDPGNGIDPSVKDRLFGKFVSKSGRAKGTGLGLYLCRAIVEAHGGKIMGENNGTGRGATFTFTLPAS